MDITHTVSTQFIYQSIMDHLVHLVTICSTGTVRGNTVWDTVYVIPSHMVLYEVHGTARSDTALVLVIHAVLGMDCTLDMFQLVTDFLMVMDTDITDMVMLLVSYCWISVESAAA